MDENFNVIAQSRAGYYTPNSPVQFVRIEVLQGDQTHENAICLTFKNIAPTVITQLEIVFKCKGADGTLLCEQSFHYDDLQVQTGELFGMDDAVFVTKEAIGSADVLLEKVYSGKKIMSLGALTRVRLSTPKELAPEVAHTLCARVQREELMYELETFEYGWRCACGAFHPKEEDTVYCTECGTDRILLEKTLHAIMVPETVRPMVTTVPSEPESDTRVAPDVQTREDATRQFTASERSNACASAKKESETVRVGTHAAKQNADQFARQYAHDLEDDDDEFDPRDELAETLIRWVPALTALVCAAIAMGGFLYCQFML